MKPFIIMGVVLTTLGACQKNEDTSLVRQCGEYAVQARFADRGAVMHAQINGKSVTLTSAVAASGAKYDGRLKKIPITLWGRGDKWIMILDDDMIIDCVAK